VSTSVSHTERYPPWCRCHEAYRIRHLIDPSCPHEEFEDVAALLDALDANGTDALGDLVVRNAYNNVAAFIRTPTRATCRACSSLAGQPSGGG